jgi:hypothetical protein
MLVLTPPDELEKTITCLETKYDNDFKKFWTYFRRVWLNKFPMTYWNIPVILSKLQAKGGGTIIRTNCALERYNRKLNDVLGTHPDLKVILI